MIRADWVDYAKGIGIILVVYGHVARGLYNAGVALPEPIYRLIDSIVYSFHMPLFFFLAGLFFYDSFSKRGGQKLVFNKLDTVFYPYLLWSLTQGSIEVILSNYTNGEVIFSEVLALLWSPRAQFWFLYALFTIFVVSSVVFSLVSKKFSLLAFFIAAILYLLQSILPQFTIGNYLYQNLVFFYFGLIFTIYFRTDGHPVTRSLIILSIAFIAAQWVFHISMSLTYLDRGIASLLIALISILFIAALSIWISEKKFKALAFIGASSMAIYLMHILAGSGARVILNSFLGISSYIPHLIAGCFFGILLPIIALVIVQKFKIPYIFSAPLSEWLTAPYHKFFRQPEFIE